MQLFDSIFLWLPLSIPFVVFFVIGLFWVTYFVRIRLVRRHEQRHHQEIREQISALGADMCPRPIASYQPGD